MLKKKWFSNFLLFHLSIYREFCSNPLLFLTILSVVSYLVYKLCIFWTCLETLTIFIFEGVFSFSIESLVSAFRFFFLAVNCTGLIYINCTLHIIHCKINRQCLYRKVFNASIKFSFNCLPLFLFIFADQ